MKKDIRKTITVSLFILVLFTAVVGVDKLSSSNQAVQSKQTVQSEKGEPKKKLTTDKVDEKRSVTSGELNNSEEKGDVATQKAKVTVQAKETQPTQQPKQTASVATQSRANTNQTVNRGASRSDELFWLARIVQAEAEGESYIGKVAIANVILNRVNSPNFPNSIYGVIFDKQYGYTQFSPVLDGRIYNNPSAESYQAAQAALNGQRPVGSALYFLNPRKSENFWIPQNRQYMMTLEQHDFYY